MRQLEYWIQTRWPDGVRCVACDHETVYRIQTVGKTGKPSLIFECGKCSATLLSDGWHLVS